jgi:HAD superfamily hydrolase (TIGR01509 family)
MYDVHALLCKDYGLSISREEFVSYYDALADEIYGSCVAEIPGISDLVKTASSWVPGLGVCSSSPLRWIDIVLRRFQLASYFQVIVSAQELDGRGKPDPAIYLLTAKRLGVQPGRVLAIEDSEKGIKSAKTAGMKCIGLSNGFNKPQDLVQADFIAQSTAAITLETVRGLFA